MGYKKISLIRYGTVIDHILHGRALKVLKILKIDEDYVPMRPNSQVSFAMNVFSHKSETRKKDIVKIENRELEKIELGGIALIAPEATYNIIRNWEIVTKERIIPPKNLEGVLICSNQTCISNIGTQYARDDLQHLSREPITPKANIRKVDGELNAVCFYCNKITPNYEIVDRLL